MKKIFAVILMLAVLTGCAFAEGAYVLYNGLSYVENDTAVQIAEGEILCPQAVEDGVYFVSRAETGEDEYEDTLYFSDRNGALRVIGEALRKGCDYQYTDDYSQVIDYTAYNGYTDMTVYGDHIYFIGNDGVGGDYTVRCTQWGDDYNGSYDTAYESGAAVYRMDLDGGNLSCLISGLGNAGAHLAIANDRIAVSSCWRNNIFAYDFSNFMLYDLDGRIVKTILNDTESRHSWIYKDEEEFTVIVDRIYTDGETIYASLSDSEGDFASSMLVNMENSDEVMKLEAFFTNSVFTDQGLVYLTSDAQSDFWDENMENTLRVCLDDGDGERMLAYIPAEYSGYMMELSANDEYAYLATESTLIRAPLAGGEAERLENGAFIPAPECTAENDASDAGAPEIDPDAEEADYLLPDSDTRLYSKDELKDYDVDTLALMRNEILARHGYPFVKDKYKEYFGNQSWYECNENFQYSDLNKTEMENVETIKALEEKK